MNKSKLEGSKSSEDKNISAHDGFETFPNPDMYYYTSEVKKVHNDDSGGCIPEVPSNVCLGCGVSLLSFSAVHTVLRLYYNKQ